MSWGTSSTSRVRRERQRQRPLAVGALWQRVFLAAVDAGRRGSPLALVPGSSPFGLGSSFARGLDVGRGLARGGRRVEPRGSLLLLGETLGQGEQGEDNRLRPLGVDRPRLLGSQLRTEQGLQSSRLQGFRTGGHDTS